MEEGSHIFSMENIRNTWLKFFEDMFRHVLQMTEGIELTTKYDFTSVVRKFERFAQTSGLKPPSEPECDYETPVEYRLLSLENYSVPRTASSASGHASLLESACASGYTPASESASGYTHSSESGLASATGYTHPTESVSGFASASELASATGYMYSPESPSGSASASELESATGCAHSSESVSGSATASGSASASGCASAFGYAPADEFQLDFSDIFNTYDRNLGLSIQRVLIEVAGSDIDKFYQRIKEKIKTKECLKAFCRRLAIKFLHGSPQEELYFLTIMSRMFSLAYITENMNPKIFIEAVADTIFESEMDLQLASINTAELILSILRDSKGWIREFRDLKCGDAVDYFSA